MSLYLFSLFVSLTSYGLFFLLWKHHRKVGDFILELYEMQPDAGTRYYKSRYTDWLWDNRPTDLGIPKIGAIFLALICLVPMLNLLFTAVMVLVDLAVICRIVYLRVILKWPSLLEELK